MPSLRITKHARSRMQQRGFRNEDVALFIQAATQVNDDSFLLTRADAAREITKRKREIQQLERLSGSKFIIEGGAIVTCYHANHRELKKTMRSFRGSP